MSNLILIKHSLPEIIPTVPASEWHLSEEGRRRCEKLAGAVTRYQPQVIVTSREPKALETGQLLGDALHLPVTSAANLHEHERRSTTFVSHELFEADVLSFFAHPGQRVMGEETADQAHSRFAAAVWSVVKTHPDQNLAIVAHGTVISLFVARLTGIQPFPFWKQLGLPSLVVIALPEIQLVTVNSP